jgi:hypothetical protein
MSVVPHEGITRPTPETAEKSAGAVRNILGNTAFRIAAGITGAAATAAVVVGMHEIGHTDDVHAAEKPSVSYDIDASTPDQFWSGAFTDEQRVEWAVDQLHMPSADPDHLGMTVEDAAYQRLQSKLNELGRPQLNDLVDASKDNTPNEANVQNIVGVAAAYYVDGPDTVKTADHAEKMLAASMDDDSTLLAQTRANVREEHLSKTLAERLNDDFETTYVAPDAASVAAGERKEQATAISENGAPIGNYIPEPGVPTRIALVHDSQRPEISENVQKYEGGRWVNGRIIWPSDASVWIPPKQVVNIQIDEQPR